MVSSRIHSASEVAQEFSFQLPDATDCIALSPRIPHPYKAILAISSDLDETPDKEVFFETLKFLNTSEQTSMGRGVDLEVGNTIYFDMPDGQFSYWNTDQDGREMIHRLIRSGHVDSLHSFGDLASTRTHAKRNLSALQENGCRLRVWIDHAVAPTNLGADIMRGNGDIPGHPAFHADLTEKFGIRYIWTGRVTSVIGQNRPLSFRGIVNPRRPVASARTICKDVAKRCLAAIGNRKYSLQRHNRLCEIRELRNGTKFIEFIRCNPHWGGVSSCDTGYGIADVLTPRFLDTLARRGGWCILYTHLGKLSAKSPRSFDPSAIEAFRRLADYYHGGKILVTTTARLLDQATGVTSVTEASLWPKLSFPAL